MLVAYGHIAHTLWFHTTPGEPTSTGLDSAASAKRLDERKRVVRMLVIIVSVFAVSWFPYFTLQVRPNNCTILLSYVATQMQKSAHQVQPPPGRHVPCAPANDVT